MNVMLETAVGVKNKGFASKLSSQKRVKGDTRATPNQQRGNLFVATYALIPQLATHAAAATSVLKRTHTDCSRSNWKQSEVAWVRVMSSEAEGGT